MNIKDITLQLVKYSMPEIRIFIKDQEIYTVHKNEIVSFVIDKDFENELFPFYQLQLNIPTKIYNQMKRSSMDITVYFKTGYARFPDQDPHPEIKFSTEIEGKFLGVISDSSPDIYERDVDERASESGNKDGWIGDMVNMYILLYNKEYYYGCNKMVNDILSSANLIDALTYVLNRAGMSNILVSPPTNQKVYSEFKLPPLSASEHILRICHQYGLFNSGAVIHFDLMMGYIVDKLTTCNCWKPNEYYTTYLVSLMQSSKKSTTAYGCYCNSKEKYNLINLSPDIAITNDAVATGYAAGSGFLAINNNTGDVSTIAPTIGGVASGIRSAFVYSSGDNIASVIKTQIEQSAKVLTTSFSCAHLGSLTPNKEFILTLEDPKFSQYNGKYRLTRVSCAFDMDGGMMVPNYTAIFKG